MSKTAKKLALDKRKWKNIVGFMLKFPNKIGFNVLLEQHIYIFSVGRIKLNLGDLNIPLYSNYIH